MSRRTELQELLESILGSRNVYFQPPASIKMSYPCIVYNREDVDVKYADDAPYTQRKRYLVTVIDSDPDSAIPDRVGSLRFCSFSRHFTADNLNHDVYSLYY